MAHGKCMADRIAAKVFITSLKTWRIWLSSAAACRCFWSADQCGSHMHYMSQKTNPHQAVPWLKQSAVVPGNNTNLSLSQPQVLGAYISSTWPTLSHKLMQCLWISILILKTSCLKNKHAPYMKALYRLSWSLSQHGQCVPAKPERWHLQ